MRSSHNSSTARMAMVTTKTTRSAEERSHVHFAPHTKLDLDVMEAFVVKDVEAVESHIACYPER